MRVLQNIGFADPPDDPFHGPPINAGLPATMEDTRENKSFHAPLPKEHNEPAIPIAMLEGPATEKAKKILWVREPKNCAAAEMPISGSKGTILFSQLYHSGFHPELLLICASETDRLNPGIENQIDINKKGIKRCEY